MGYLLTLGEGRGGEAEPSDRGGAHILHPILAPVPFRVLCASPHTSGVWIEAGDCFTFSCSRAAA